MARQQHTTQSTSAKTGSIAKSSSVTTAATTTPSISVEASAATNATGTGTTTTSHLMSASSFVQSIGVNVHLNYFDTNYANAASVAADIKYLGITYVRDVLPSSDPASLAPYAALAAAGVKFDLIVAAGGNVPSMAQVKAELDAFETRYPGSIASVEGPNEPNIWPIQYGGKSGTAAAVQFQADLYRTVKADPLLAGVQVDDFAFGGVGAATYAEAGNQSSTAQAANIHVYPDGQYDGTPQPEIQNEKTLASVSVPGQGMVMTEFGYSTYAGGDVSQATQARFEVDGLLDAAEDGISQTYIYELLDSSTGSSDPEGNYGQFASNTTTPKLAATAIHNLTSILADSGSGALPSLAFLPTVTGLPAHAETLMLEKTDGTVDLAIWDEDAAVNATLTISTGGRSVQASVYDPLHGSTPAAAFNGSSFNITLGTDPLIIAIKE